MPDDDPPSSVPVTREDLIQSVQHGMLFEGRKRAHHWDRINAQIAAEKLVDYLMRSGYIIRQKPPHSGPRPGFSHRKPNEQE